MGFAKDETSGGELAVYRPLHPCEHTFFLRPRAMFFENLLGVGPRFIPLDH